MTRHCPDCDIAPGQSHVPGCDVERCPECGGQRIACGCRADDPPLPWTGEWPGEAECREFGWFVRWIGAERRWEPCDADTPDALPDLNRLHDSGDARWDRAARRWVLA